MNFQVLMDMWDKFKGFRKHLPDQLDLHYFFYALFCHPEEGEGGNGLPATSRHTRKSNSFDTGNVCHTLPGCCAPMI